jgi:sRNA-binding protein
VSARPNLARDTIVALAELFPQCFAVFQGHRRPLKIGIHADVVNALASAITAKEASLALAIYCGNHGYLKACCKVGAARIDLNGNVAGSVSAEEADNAKQRLAQRRAKQARRQQALAKAKAAPVGEHDWQNRGSAPPDPGIVAGGIAIAPCVRRYSADRKPRTSRRPGRHDSSGKRSESETNDRRQPKPKPATPAAPAWPISERRCKRGEHQ